MVMVRMRMQPSADGTNVQHLAVKRELITLNDNKRQTISDQTDMRTQTAAAPTAQIVGGWGLLQCSQVLVAAHGPFEYKAGQPKAVWQTAKQDTFKHGAWGLVCAPVWVNGSGSG